jgi:hypothetical protein
MGGSFSCQFGTGTRPRPFVQRVEALGDKPLARPFNGGDARLDRLRNLLIGQVLIRFEQNPSAGQLAATGFATAAQPHQGIALCCC